MSNLSELLPAGAGAKSADFVASGTLGSGVTVALKSDGTVEAVTVTGGVGTPVVFESANSVFIASTYDIAAEKVVIAYRDIGNSNYGTAIVGTVSGTSISFGIPVVFNSGDANLNSVTYDSAAQKIVIAYQDGSNGGAGTAIVGTVSGTSISFGTAVVFNSGITRFLSTTFDSTNSKVVICYSNNNNSLYGTGIVATVSGTSISFGTAVVFESADSQYMSATYDANSQKIVIAYRDIGNSNYGTAIIGTVSGTSISFGTAVVFNSGSSFNISVAYDASALKVVIAYGDWGNSGFGTALVGTVSGTSISFGSEVVFESAASSEIATTYDSANGKIVIAYRDSGNSNYGTAIVGTVSGTSISFDSPVIFESAASTYIASTYDIAAEKVVIAYRDGGNSSFGTSVVFQPESSNNTDFIGITDQAIADTATGAVIVQGGVSEKLSGLTVGADYYVQADGSLSSPTAPAPYNLSGASYDSVSFSVNSQEPAPNAVVFNPTGTKMFVVGQTNNTVYEYALATGFDVSTASYTQSFSVSAQSAYSVGLAFNLDGTKMFVADYTNSNVYEYALSTGFNVSTASYTQTLSVSTQSSGPSGLVFNLDGTKMFITAFTGQDVNEYSLSTAFDISTATYAQNFSTASQETEPQETVFSSNGKKMFVVGSNTSTIYEYSLSTGYDISTASYSSISFSVSSQEAQSRGLAFNSSGNKFFMCGGFSGGAVYQYSTGAGSVTSVPAGRALSSTSILLEG